MPPLDRERLDAGIEVLRLDRPEVRNALDTATLEALLEALAELAADPALRVLVFSTTNPRALSAGADVGEVLTPAQGVAAARSWSSAAPAWPPSGSTASRSRSAARTRRGAWVAVAARASACAMRGS